MGGGGGVLCFDKGKTLNLKIISVFFCFFTVTMVCSPIPTSDMIRASLWFDSISIVSENLLRNLVFFGTEVKPWI